MQKELSIEQKRTKGLAVNGLSLTAAQQAVVVY